MLSNTKGGGNSLINNEIFSESQLDKELTKFEAKFKARMDEFNEPIKQLLVKRSDYRIKQKLSLNEFLEMFSNEECIKGLNRSKK